MTDHEKLSYLTDRPCTACKFHKENGCSKWSCVFEEKSDVPEGEYIKKEDIIAELGDTNMDIFTDEVKEIVNSLPTVSFPNREKGTDLISREKALAEFKRIYFDNPTVIRCAELVLNGMPSAVPDREKGEWLNTEEEGQCKCNKCGEICGFKKDKTYGYYVAEDICPNCGADMRGDKAK